MKHEPKKHFDISKPHHYTPDPTSKPVIVGHHPTMPDPMIREERDKAARPINVISDRESPEPIKTDQPQELADEVSKTDLPNLSENRRPIETVSDVPPRSSDGHKTASVEPLTHSRLESKVVPLGPTPGAIFHPPAAPITSSVDAATMPPVSYPLDQPVQPAKEADPPVPAPSEPLAGQELHIPAGKAVIHHKPRVWVWVVMALIALAWAYAAIDVLSGIKLPYEFFKSVP